MVMILIEHQSELDPLMPFRGVYHVTQVCIMNGNPVRNSRCSIGSRRRPGNRSIDRS
jgi:hypothetical protein